jgi:NAD(P)-dependent dehydrogenase (short-subunit alcohol dehydrogenase family)
MKFAAQGFHVVLMARREEVSAQVAAEVVSQGGLATFIRCDVADDASVIDAFQKAVSLGNIEILVFNVGTPFPPGFQFPNLPRVQDIETADFNACFNIAVTGLVRCVQQVIPLMLERERGTILISGATMALRSGVVFAALAPAMFARRALGQSMFQDYAPKGVHVAHVIIDGVIDSPNTRPWASDGKMMLHNTADLAGVFWSLHMQPRSVWSYEQQVTPMTETVGMRL